MKIQNLFTLQCQFTDLFANLIIKYSNIITHLITILQVASD
jgi:hypothetical protein